MGNHASFSFREYLILSPFLLKLSLIFSVFPLSGLCYRPYGLSLTLLTKKVLPSNIGHKNHFLEFMANTVPVSAPIVLV